MEGSKIISEFQSSKCWDGFDARARVKVGECERYVLLKIYNVQSVIYPPI